MSSDPQTLVPAHELTDRLHPTDQLRGAAALKVLADTGPTEAQDFLTTIESLASLERSARVLLHRLIAHRGPEAEPSMRQIAAVTGLSHSTVFRITHRTPSPETTAPSTNGEAL